MSSRSWTSQDDFELLRAVRRYHRLTEVDWCEVALHVAGRNNRDCRKRWYNHIAAENNRGLWSADEDARLKVAYDSHGPAWTKVAAQVVTRNGDQCSKRWNDSLRPDINRQPWSSEEDKTLLNQVGSLGRRWKEIADRSFPDRTPLSLKNRAALLERRLRSQTQIMAPSGSRLPAMSALAGWPATRDTPTSDDEGMDLAGVHYSDSISGDTGHNFGYTFNDNLNFTSTSASNCPSLESLEAHVAQGTPIPAEHLYSQHNLTTPHCLDQTAPNVAGFNFPASAFDTDCKSSVHYEDPIDLHTNTRPADTGLRRKITFEVECDPADLGSATQQFVAAFRNVEVLAHQPVLLRVL